MAIAHIETVKNGGAGSSTTITTAATPADGSLLFALVQSAGGVTGAPSGWTQIHDINFTGSSHITTYFKIAAGEGTTFVFTGTTITAAQLMVFTGTATVSPQDVESAASNASATAMCAPSVTTLGNNDVLIFAGLSTTNTRTVTPPTGMIEPTNGELAVGAATQEVAYLLDAGAAGATGDKTATLSGVSANTGFLVAFKIAPPGVAPPPFRRPNTLLRM